MRARHGFQFDNWNLTVPPESQRDGPMTAQASGLGKRHLRRVQPRTGRHYTADMPISLRIQCHVAEMHRAAPLGACGRYWASPQAVGLGCHRAATLWRKTLLQSVSCALHQPERVSVRFRENRTRMRSGGSTDRRSTRTRKFQILRSLSDFIRKPGIIRVGRVISEVTAGPSKSTRNFMQPHFIQTPQSASDYLD